MNTAPNDDCQPAAEYHAARLSRRSLQDPFLDEVISLLPALRAFGYSLCGDASRADDLAQDTMIKAHLKREQFQASSNLKAWLFTILRNRYISDLRRRKFEIEDPADVHGMSLSIEPDYSVGQQMDELSDALQRLPCSQREALVLVHVVGLPYDKAAQHCGVAVGTIKSRIARGRSQLMRWIDRPIACTATG